ncbi:FimV/HubP family polar landmark protein [Pseudomonas citronellolis]|uniref:FimV/HubP family polar landmark protein n=1 Tax=Pseudomonas citronellolis TaxID=53408 RepID=UPI000E2F2E03|nr:FimV/HubP family polar landmark protein [Pseudomonas citronellolis]UXJ51158.1 FimV family protein [Pseudomonas citronellolis]
MVRLRKLVQAIAAASALTTGMAHALGLGDIHLHSALNQPLNADIDVTDVRDLTAGEIIPKLASPEDFSKSGVDRNFFLTGLKFTAVVQPNGKSVIHVTSDKPVQEPYLNFLVEVLWPSGRVLREYTVLLDPPLYSPQVAAAAAPRAPVAAPAPIARQPVAPAAPRAVEPAPAASAPRQARLDGNEYRTGSRDTLWEIASRARPDGSVTVNQTMLAIQDLNPDAFLDGNINRLKSGQVLRLPDAEQIRSRSAGEADVQVREQRSAWREGRSLAGSSRQLDATRRANAGAAPEQAESKDNLRLVSGEAGKAKGSDKGAKNGKALSDKLAVTQESLDSTRRENDELQSRMTDLQSQLDKLQKLIELKDAQLAKLQGELATTPQPAAPGSAPAGQPPAPGAEAPAAPAAAPQPDATPAAPAQPAAPAAAKPAEPKPAAPKPAAPAPAAENEPGLIEELLANPTLLAAIGGSLVLVLLLVLLLLRRRAAQAEAAKVEPAVAGPSGTDEPLELAAGEFDSLSLEDEDAAPASVPAAGEKVAAQTSDPLGEADIYIAYGRFNQAAELLQGAIYDEPQRADLRLKLMEVLAEIGDREGFARQENELRELGGAEPQVEQLKSRYPGMVAAAAVAGGLAAAAASSDELEHFSLDDLDLTHDGDAPIGEPVAQAAGDLDDAFDLGLDDLQLDDEVPHAAAEPQAKADELSLEDFDLEDDLRLDEPAAVAQPAQSAKTDDDFAFDLDLEDDLAKAAPAAPTASDALDDFTLDLPDEPAAPAAKDEDFLFDLGEEGAGLAASADDDFSFDLGAESEPAAKPVEGLADDFDLSLPEEAPQELPADDSFAAQLDQVSAELDKLASDLEQPASPAASLEPEVEPSLDSALDEGDVDDEFDFLSGADEAATKLDLARAYIDMGDAEGARDILDEVISEGSDQQQQEARELLERLS